MEQQKLTELAARMDGLEHAKDMLVIIEALRELETRVTALEQLAGIHSQALEGARDAVAKAAGVLAAHQTALESLGAFQPPAVN